MAPGIRTQWPAACDRRYCHGLLLFCALSTACTFDLPPASTFRSAANQVLVDLPFHSGSVSTIAWHPGGRKLAVAEEAGVRSVLAGTSFSNLQTRAYATLPVRAGFNWQALPGSSSMVGENNDGQLVARSLDGSLVRVYFEGPVAHRSWSLSEDGTQLLYATGDYSSKLQIRMHHFTAGEDFVLIDSLQAVRGFKIIPDGSGFLVWQHLAQNEAHSQRVHYYSLPERNAHRSFAASSRDFLFSPSKEGSRLAYVHERSSPSGIDSLIVLQVDTGRLWRLPLANRPASALIWIDNDRIALWERQPGLHEQEREQMSLRVYSFINNTSQLIAQRPTFGNFYNTEIFALAGEVLYFLPSPPRVCLFDPQSYSCEELFALPDFQHQIGALVWIAEGEKLFLHAYDESRNSNFYLIGREQIDHYRKSYSASSVSLLPNERDFVGVVNQRLLRDEIAASAPQTLLAHLPCTSVAVHPSGEHAAAFGRPHRQSHAASTQPLLLIDLRRHAVLDSLMLPEADDNELQWLPSDHDRTNFSALWRRASYQSLSTDYYHVAFGLRLILPIHHDGLSSDFNLFPTNNFLCVLSGNELLLSEWRIETP